MAIAGSPDGPWQKVPNTIQFAPDGLNFEVVAVIENPPRAGGPFRPKDPDIHPLEGFRWGLCHVGGWRYVGSSWDYIQKFDVDERMKSLYLVRKPIV